jgi:hypothetical protein
VKEVKRWTVWRKPEGIDCGIEWLKPERYIVAAFGMAERGFYVEFGRFQRMLKGVGGRGEGER